MISLFGSAIQRFCMSLYVLDLTGSPGIFATILSISMLPYVLLAPVAGNITDYFSKKKIMVCTDIFSCKYYIFTGGDSLHPSVCFSKTALPGQWHCTADRIRCQFCRTCHCGDAVWFSGDPLDRGFKCNQLLCLSADGRISASAGKKNGSRNKLSFLGSVNEMYQGFLYLKKFQSIILKIIFSYGLSNLFIVPVFSVAAPHFIKNVLGLSSEVYGSVEGITVLGMITGGVLISVFPKRFSMAVIHRVLSLGLFNVISLTYMQQAVPGSMIGKTSAFSTAAATATIPPGQFLFGQILESGISVPVLFLFVSAASLGTAYFVKQAIKKN